MKIRRNILATAILVWAVASCTGEGSEHVKSPQAGNCDAAQADFPGRYSGAALAIGGAVYLALDDTCKASLEGPYELQREIEEAWTKSALKIEGVGEIRAIFVDVSGSLEWIDDKRQSVRLRVEKVHKISSEVDFQAADRQSRIWLGKSPEKKPVAIEPN